MGHAGNAVGTSITGSEWIATGLRPRDDKGSIFTMKGMKKIEILKFVIARRTEWTTRQSIVSRERERRLRFVTLLFSLFTLQSSLFIHWFSEDVKDNAVAY